MPILDLQQRMRQLGEIRIGTTVDTGRKDKNGKPLRRPTKLNKFRFTSPSRELLDQVAALYGGTVQPWTPQNGGPAEFEVVTTTNRLPVIIPPRNSYSQWYELYQGSRCVRRCDGQTELKSDSACVCNPDKRECATTTRLNVMLKDVPGLGVWLLTSHGYYAAVSLPASAELLAATGGYIPGWLGMEEKKIPTDDGTHRFMVPTLDVMVSPAALLSGKVPGISQAPAAAALTSGDRAALEGAVPDYLAKAKAAKTADEVVTVYEAAQFAGHLTPELDASIKAVGGALRAKEAAAARQQQPTSVPAAPIAAQAPAPVTPEVVDVEVVEDPSDVWMLVVGAAGGLGWTTDRLEQEFAARNGGTMPGSASTGEMRAFLAGIKSGSIR